MSKISRYILTTQLNMLAISIMLDPQLNIAVRHISVEVNALHYLLEDNAAPVVLLCCFPTTFELDLPCPDAMLSTLVTL